MSKTTRQEWTPRGFSTCSQGISLGVGRGYPGLDALQEVEPQFQGKGYVLRSELLANASEAIRRAGVCPPPPVRPVE